MFERLSPRRFRISRRSSPLWALAALLALQAQVLPAVDGLDDNPGGAGWVAFDLDLDKTDLSSACAAQSDGKIILAGQASDDDGEGFKIALARFGPDGLLDPSFGTNGRVVIDMTALGYALNYSAARAVIVDSRGGLLVVGTTHLAAGGGVQVFVTRLLADGVIDQTWLYNGISGGWYFSDYLKGVEVAALDPSGILWIVGPKIQDLTGDWAFLRLSEYGAELDAETIPVDPTDFWATTIPTALLFQPDGKAVIGGWGYLSSAPTVASFLFLRLATFLQLDPTFGPYGTGLVTLYYGSSAQLQSLGQQPDGSLIVAGQIGPLAGEDLIVTRLSRDGTVDGASFNQVVAFDIGGSGGDGSDGLNRMVVQSDGKIVLAARALTGDPGNNADTGVARLLANGQLDTSFGGLGTGKRTFGMASPPPGNGDEGALCLVLAAGKPIVAGWAEYIGQDIDFVYRRLTSPLIFADTFESGTSFFWSAVTP